ncbi:hypothetical protein [Sulfurospirillum barnesii]|uniref:Uncharacterized protein n=1 Tax=Sulfurospirillum barnesii (strain ATCC 700032 / DSM 10660 / SES-3) TaxID=760154 RepID=I3XWE0_SULBS|nr:hypothetical protein [Sulfurospirillum barnesii]AFL68264.1 hypothetical protein Sulba_0963 [Sulfurospirillum barnesii SES-3]
MFDDKTLKLLETYRREKYNEKVHGSFTTNNKKNKTSSHFLWLTLLAFIGYFGLTNLINLKEKLHETQQSKLHETQQSKLHETQQSKLHETQQSKLHETQQSKLQKPIIDERQKPIIKNVNIQYTKPSVLIENKKNEIKEPIRENETIVLMPKETPKKNEPIQEVEEEEIIPSTVSSNSFYR